MPNFSGRSHRAHSPGAKPPYKVGRAHSRTLKEAGNIPELDCWREESWQDYEVISPHFLESNDCENHNRQAVEI